ncbi:hypothetical protein [Sphingobacterium bambusae]
MSLCNLVTFQNAIEHLLFKTERSTELFCFIKRWNERAAAVG